MALEDVLIAKTVRPVVVGWLDFKDDPLRGWSGPGVFAPTGTGDTDLDGETFVAAEGAVEVSDFVENQELGGPITVTLMAGEMEDEEGVQQLVADRRAFVGRRAKFWRFFLSADESSVGSEFYVLFNGVMVGAKTVREPGKPAVITITCDQDLQGARRPPARWADHQVFYPADTASTFMSELARGGLASALRTRTGRITSPGSVNIDRRW